MCVCNSLAFAQKSFKCALEARGHLTVETERAVRRCSLNAVITS